MVTLQQFVLNQYIMSLYDLLHRKKGQQVSLNNTKVSQKLQQELLSQVKPKETKPTAPLLLLSHTNPDNDISKMPGRFLSKDEKIKYAQENGKRPREKEHQSQLEQVQKANHKPLKGQSQQLFKPFLRITDIQAPDQIRTLDTLHKAFKRVKQMAKSGYYDEINDQLQSIRQDLHVQQIENDFVIEVLEFSLQYSLKNGDIVGFCKNTGQLRQISHALKVKMKPLHVSLHITYLLLNSLFNEYQKLIETIDLAYLVHPVVRRSMALYKLLMIGNYTRILRDYGQCKDLEYHLMAHYREKLLIFAIGHLKITVQNNEENPSKAISSILGINKQEAASCLAKI